MVFHSLDRNMFELKACRVRAGSKGGACGGQTLNGGQPWAAGSRSRAPVGVQEHSPSKLLNFKHRYRWNHAILAANQQNLLEKLK